MTDHQTLPGVPARSGESPPGAEPVSVIPAVTGGRFRLLILEPCLGIDRPLRRHRSNRNVFHRLI
jgi:hypothetical protein